MKNALIIILIVVVVFVVFGVLDQYNLVNWKWSKVATIGAALAGPFRFVQNKLSEKQEEKEKHEREIQFRTIDFKHIQARQNPNREEPAPPQKPSETSDEFSISEPTFG